MTAALRRGQPVVIVGAGLGGLITALELAPLPVVVLNRSRLGQQTASAWAQGGLAAAVGGGDAPERHAADTLTAGDGLCDPQVVAMVTEEAPAVVACLERYGVRFDRDVSGQFALGREGGHGRRRIVHVRDATGDAITQALTAAARRSPSITLLEGVQAEELIVVDGAVTGVRARRGNAPIDVAARAVVLATGGCAALYARTSNPLGARGSGLIMAARAGARLADLEFVQFHPTAIAAGRDPMPLATEALRGEGATIVDEAGERFLCSVHPLAELAPRDVVARAIFRRRAGGGAVYLDARKAPGARLARHFPTVYAACREAGIDPLRERIPVAPAAHFHMGGIAVDDAARSSLPGLWAVGEVTATGLHGANRLASNSLLEAAVFGRRAARDIAVTVQSRPRRAPAKRTAVAPRVAGDISGVRRLMDRNVGVERDAASLVAALTELRALASAGQRGVLADAATAGLLIAGAALARRESRGGHHRRDFPGSDPALARRSATTLDAILHACCEEHPDRNDTPVALAASG